ESLGRWSLYDVRVNRLVASAFQVELADEELTFLADDPIDFAYRGVEHMAEVWARYKTMTMPRRLMAVPRSRKGVTPSRIQEFHDAMMQNLRAESGRSLSGDFEQRPSTTQTEEAVAPSEPTSPVRRMENLLETSTAESVEAEIPLVGAAPAEPVSEKQPAEVEGHDDAIAAEREALAVERAKLEEQRAQLDAALARAEQLEKERLDAARVDMDRIDTERRALEAERVEREKLEAERVAAEREQIKRLEDAREKRQKQQTAALDAKRRELEQLEEAKRVESERLDQERQEIARLEAERVEREKADTARIQAERDELERLRVERLEKEKAEAARIEAERVELERIEAERAEAGRIERERLEKERIELERLEAERAAREKAEVDRLESERQEAELAARANAEKERLRREEAESKPVVEEVLGTSGDGDDPETAKELVVDLGAFEERDEESATPTRPGPDPEPEPALAGAADKSGIMGAVKAAFSRSGKNHVHDFTEAPGGIGMVRYICRECGYVSISSAD
ncbi:MAG: hypothetical protein WBM90_13950, partial [Acidimicrobiia bacterium]